MTVDPRTVAWRFCHFDSLGVHDLQSILAARQAVFAIEQHCVYLDVDGADASAFHLAAWTEDHQLLAYARLPQPGVKYADPSIGRVLTTAAARGTGLGRELMRRAILHARRLWPEHDIRISAQSRLEPFYGSLGFEVDGDRYLEDGIPHTEMFLKHR